MASPPLSNDPIAEAHRQWVAHGWSAAADGMAAVTSVMRAQQIMQARVDQVLRPHGVTFARYELLMLLHFSRRGALPINKVSTRLQVHPTSVTNAVDRLEQAGLVERQPHPTDRRTTLVAITPPGRQLALAATADLNTAVFEQPQMPARSVDALVASVTELRRRAGDFA